MVIKDKLERERESKTFRRVDSTHPIDIFLGCNDKGLYTMSITVKGKCINIESSRAIDVGIFQFNTTKIRLNFTLLDNDKGPVFYKFCDDIIESTRTLNEDTAFAFIISRWKKWCLMFKKSNSDIMTENEIVGLIGELIFLKNYMIPKYGEDKALEAWGGPLNAKKDFEIDDTWHEIKTVRPSSLTVKISSLEQLDSDVTGFLEVITLEKCNREVENKISLNELVDKIDSIMNNFELYMKFNEKLSEVGYTKNKEYDNYNYKLIKSSTYIVEEGFPRIIKDELKESIVRVKYEILLEDIKKYLKVI